MLNFISFLTGSAHPESREFPSPSGRGSFGMRAGKEKKLFPFSLFLFLWWVSYKKKKGEEGLPLQKNFQLNVSNQAGANNNAVFGGKSSVNGFLPSPKILNPKGFD
jgi:hypothetical protein